MIITIVINDYNYNGSSLDYPRHNDGNTYSSGEKGPPPPPPPKNFNREHMTRTMTNSSSSSTMTAGGVGGEWQPMVPMDNKAAGGSGSDRLNSMAQRMMKREVVTTTTESKSEHQTKTHNFRMD